MFSIATDLGPEPGLMPVGTNYGLAYCYQNSINNVTIPPLLDSDGRLNPKRFTRKSQYGITDKKVYCLISDGETAEGSIWEALRFIKEKNIQNIEIHCSCNGYAAYDNVDIEYLKVRLVSFLPTIKFHLTNGDFFPFLKKLNAHYHIMSENDYKIANQILT